MTNNFKLCFAALATFIFAMSTGAVAQSRSNLPDSTFLLYQASAIPQMDLIQPEALAKILQTSKSPKPLLIQVGSHVLYQEAHIPGSEYIGPAASGTGLDRLRQRLQSAPRAKFIVLYCGCCPWTHCPNVKPAWDLLHSMGFSKVKVLYMANNFGTDWVDKGYPIAKGD